MILKPQRHLFTIPHDVCYLNAAYMTPLTKAQEAIGGTAIKQSMQPWTTGAEDFFPVVEDIRRLSARIINGSPDDIAIIPSVSYGMATAARNLPFAAGKKILVLEDQFPSNIYEWQRMAGEHGGDILTVATPSDDDLTSAVLQALEGQGSDIAIAALPNVHWSSGAKLDLAEISSACRRQGVRLVLDLTQSVGAMPFDVKVVDPDFAVAGGYKWMMGPYSLGVMYVAPRWQEGNPLEQNWIAREGSEDFAGLVRYRDSYQGGARRYDVGERSNFILAPIYRQGLMHLLDWGIDNIAETLAALNTRLADAAREYGLRPVSEQCRGPHLLGVHVGDQGTAVLEGLKSAGIIASVRGSMLRLSPHLWVNENDEDRFLKALETINVPK